MKQDRQQERQNQQHCSQDITEEDSSRSTEMRVIILNVVGKAYTISISEIKPIKSIKCNKTY
jgi:hypothetical protein